jgi:hypothetical protein
VLYNRVSAQGYKESQGDVLAVSGVVEDIRDALLDYQVGSYGIYIVIVLLKPGRFNRWPNNGRCMTGAAS